MSISPVIIEKARQWSVQDPNEITASYVKNLLTSATTQDASNHGEAVKELSTLFPQDDKRIGFGTAGLRAAMEVGPLRMNDLVIIQTAQGLARYCLSQNRGKGGKLRAVVGYDHRENPTLSLSSRSFALLSALVLAEAGIECILLDGFVHTPLVAFATTRLNAAVGVMITASHNPKADNGYKVYWSDGCQIRPPVDKGIAQSILDNLKPWSDYGSLLSSLKDKHENDPCLGLSSPETTQEMTNSYFDCIQSSGLVTGQAKLLNDKTVSWTPPTAAYTAMHGIAGGVAVRSFETFGLPPFHSVPSQAKPDYTFPTVPFPNPEEKGALDLARAFAEEKNCDIVLANDPDGDRLALAERDRVTEKWFVFTGDQIGIMLGHWLWESIGKDCGKPVAMCASTVSSKMLAAIAKAEGFHFEDTLTGFKWIGSRAAALSGEGYRALFAYEEAIGFCCGDVIRDKDGISALGVMMELAYHVYHKGNNLASHMQSLYDKYGEFVSNNGYYFCHDPAIVQKIIEGMRNGGKYMSKVAEYEVESIRDLGVPGYDSTTPDHKPTLPTSQSSPMISIRFTNQCVAQFRASGTEPKFKYYIEMQGKPGVPRDAVSQQLKQMSQTILEELLKPDVNGLESPRSSL